MEIKHRTQLVELLKYFNLPVIGAELGTAEALNAEDLIKNGLDKLYCVDTWCTIANQKGDGGFPQSWHDKNYADATKRLNPYGDKVILLRGRTDIIHCVVDDKTLGLLYIDAAHDYYSVLNDLRAWESKVVDGGIIAGHDFLNEAYGVKDAVEYFCEGKYKVHTIEENKTEDAGFWFRKITH